jgi:hypothetical protein
LFDIYLDYVQIVLVFIEIMMLNLILQIAKPLFKRKSRTGSKSEAEALLTGGSFYFLLDAAAPDAEAEAEALKISALPHH